MIDNLGNDLPYDFKNVQFKRYKVLSSVSGAINVHNGYIGVAGSGIDYFPSNCTFDSSDYKWLYTFTQNVNAQLAVDMSMDDGATHNIVYELPGYGQTQRLANCIFTGQAHNNTFMHMPELSTLGKSASYVDYASDNTVNGRIYKCCIGKFTHNSLVGSIRLVDADSFNGNILVGGSEIFSCELNVFDANIVNCRLQSSKVYSDDCKENEFSCDITRCNFRESLRGNRITGAGSIYDNEFYDVVVDNTIVIGGEAHDNAFGGGLINNYINIRSYFYSNTFNADVVSNIIQTQLFTNNTLE